MQTAQAIVATACQIAKAPGFTTQGGTALNVILQTLAQRYDFDLNRLLWSFPTTGVYGYTLPTNYLRAKEVWFDINGSPTFLLAGPLRDFDASYQGAGTSTYPLEYATDLNAKLLYLYPLPVVPITVNVRYMIQPSDIVSPQSSSSIPWFPDQDYLTTKLASEIMKITDDDRWAAFAAQADEQLKRTLRMSDDREGYVTRVTMDPRHFRSGRNVRPTKVQGGF
ncbi:MAG: phage adaptor protein [Acidobacteriaceae bacterium]